MTLTNEQKAQVLKQLQRHQREGGLRHIQLDEETSLELLIEQGVFASDIMSSGVILARFLYQHKELYIGKDATDIGCGAGTQGIVMAKYGARSVVLSDINPKAVDNARANVRLHNLEAEVYESDLFAAIPQRKYGVTVFNHPFFSGKAEEFAGDPNKDEMLRRSMLGATELLPRFLGEAVSYLTSDGIIIMPYFRFAGAQNDPVNHVEKCEFKIQQRHTIQSTEGLQLGSFSVYVISRRN